MTAPTGDQLRQVVGQLQQTAQVHMQTAEFLLRQADSVSSGVEGLSPGDGIALALAHAVVALGYELGVPRPTGSAAPGQLAGQVPLFGPEGS